MRFTAISQDVATKILVAAADEQNVGHLSRVNKYAHSAFFSAPPTAYNVKDQANIYLLRGRHCLAEYSKTLDKPKLFEAMRYLVYAYSLNDQLDKLWLENLMTLITKNSASSYLSFKEDCLAWLLEMQEDKRSPIKDKLQLVHYLIGLIIDLMGYLPRDQRFTHARLNILPTDQDLNEKHKGIPKLAIAYYQQAAIARDLNAIESLCNLYIYLEKIDEAKKYLSTLNEMATAGKKPALLVLAKVYDSLLRVEKDKLKQQEYIRMAMLYYSVAATYDSEACYEGIRLFLYLLFDLNIQQTRLRNNLNNIAKSLYFKLEQESSTDPRASFFLASLWEKGIILVKTTNNFQLKRREYDARGYIIRITGHHFDHKIWPIDHPEYGWQIDNFLYPPFASNKIANDCLQRILYASKQHSYRAQYLLYRLSTRFSGADNYVFHRNLHDKCMLTMARNGFVNVQYDLGKTLENGEFSEVASLTVEEKAPNYWLEQVREQWFSEEYNTHGRRLTI